MKIVKQNSPQLNLDIKNSTVLYSSNTLSSNDKNRPPINKYYSSNSVIPKENLTIKKINPSILSGTKNNRKNDTKFQSKNCESFNPLKESDISKTTTDSFLNRNDSESIHTVHSYRENTSLLNNLIDEEHKGRLYFGLPLQQFYRLNKDKISRIINSSCDKNKQNLIPPSKIINSINNANNETLKEDNNDYEPFRTEINKRPTYTKKKKIPKETLNVSFPARNTTSSIVNIPRQLGNNYENYERTNRFKEDNASECNGCGCTHNDCILM